MLRKLGIGITALAMISPGMAVALEVGNQQLSSYLNQPLNMKVALHDVKGLSADDIVVNLAPQEAYDAAGVDLDYFLNKLEFDVQMGDGDSATLHIRSSEPVVEPYLNFLVEFLWPTGRLMREYTVLLDPPSFAEQSQVAAPTVSRAPAPVATTSPAPRQQQASTPSSQPARTSAPRSDSGDRSTYRVGPADTLWQIASQNRPSSDVSVQQMLVAIQELNPDAFINNNVNLVREGAVLRVPNEEDVRRVSTRDAITDVAAQNRRWQEMLEAQGRQVAQRPALDGTRQTVDRSSETGTAEQGQVRLLTPESVAGVSDGDSTGAAAGEASTAALQNELALRDENLDRLDRENSELRSRLGDLEEQIETSQQLLKLRSDQIAQLQNELRALREAEGEAVADDPLLADVDAPAALLSDDESADGADLAETERAGDTAEGDDAASDDVAALAPATGSENGAGQGGDAGSPGSAADSPAGQPGVALTPAIPEPQPQPEPVAPAQTGIVELIKQNLLYIGAGVLALLLLLLLVLRRKKDDDGEDEVVGRLDEDEAEDDDFFAAGLGDDEQADADSGAEPVTGAGGDAAQDPLEEVDVYVAYGRHPQAVEFLRGEINKAPERADLKVRLLELLKEMNDEAGFRQQVTAYKGLNPAVDQAINRLSSAEQLAELGADQNDDSDELSLDDLAMDLSSGNDEPAAAQDKDLHADADQAAVQAEEQESFDELADFDFELDSDLDDTALSSPAEPATEEEPLLTLDEDSSDDANAEDPLAGNDDDVFSFDKPEDGGLEQDEDDRYAIDAGLTSAEDGGEFELSLDDLDSDFEASGSDAPAKDDELDLSLDDFELEEAEPQAAAATDNDDLESFEFDLDEDAVTPLEAEPEQAQGIDLQLDADDLADEAESEQVPSADFDLEPLKQDDELEVDSDEAPELESPASEQPAEPQVAPAVPPAAPAAAQLDNDSDVLEDEDDFDFLGATDENATKLDLAKAYIEMGDAEGARDILNEVLAEGNEEQQAQARELLPQVS